MMELFSLLLSWGKNGIIVEKDFAILTHNQEQTLL